MNGIIEAMPDPKYEIDDVIFTPDGPELCTGRDYFERRIRNGDMNDGWLYYGCGYSWDREKKRLDWTGNILRYSERMITKSEQLTPHPKTGEPCLP